MFMHFFGGNHHFLGHHLVLIYIFFRHYYRKYEYKPLIKNDTQDLATHFT